ncbi:MAG: hypothetical protein J6Q14_08350 [Oscillospiraceae bacterium]|nr:hypothetical protein [Oscillospiraceae bacterium]
MPMYQGNYVAPVWINNMAPAIDDTELLAMSGTIQASQILKGSGPPTQYTTGVPGQRYADVSTTPPTIYKLVTAAEDANVWTAEGDANGNLALDYDPTATYDTGEYCIHAGKLYKAKMDINPAEAWTEAHWDRAYLADDVFNLTETVATKATPPDVGSITMSGTWTGSASPYSQTVTVTGATVTANSKVDLQLTAAQIASLISDGVTGMVIENNNGTLTAYAVGAAPSAEMTVQCTVEETK